MKTFSLAFAFLLGASALAELPRYKAIPLTFGNGNSMHSPIVLNDGRVFGGLGGRIGEWNNGNPVPLPIIAGSQGMTLHDVNSHGNVAGRAWYSSHAGVAHWNGASWRYLATVGSDPLARINDHDQVLMTLGQDTVVWQNNQFAYAQAPFLMDWTIGRGINNQGSVLGITEDYERIYYKQFLWTPGQTPQEISIPVFGWDINDLGHVGGEFGGPFGTHFGYWDGATRHDCGPGRFITMNNSGELLGSNLNAVYYCRNGERADLETLLAEGTPNYNILYAYSINDSGWITAVHADTPFGPSTPLLLVPVPEPGTVAGIGLGVIAMLSRLNRKKKMHGSLQ